MRGTSPHMAHVRVHGFTRRDRIHTLWNWLGWAQCANTSLEAIEKEKPA